MIGRQTLNKQQGSSLLEVLIAFFVLGVGLLGVLGLQAQSLRFTNQSYSLSQAIFLANDMAERMRANTDGVADYIKSSVPAGVTPAVDCAVNICAQADQLAEYDLVNWGNELAKYLPGATAKIVDNAPRYTIEISFLSTTEGMDFEQALTNKDWNKYSLDVRI